MPGWLAVLEGVQADQEFCKCIFKLNRYYTKKQCCHYCDVIQWTSRIPVDGENNDPNDLYTNWHADESRENHNSPFRTFLFDILSQSSNTYTCASHHQNKSHLRIIDACDFVGLHGSTALTRVMGFSPERILDIMVSVF